METYGIITTCKGRLGQLKQTLPAMLNQPHTPTVTVVDYGCPDGTFEWCRAQRHPRLQVIQVHDNVDVFCRCRAKNIGAVRSPASVLCFVDADALLDPRWLRTIGRLFSAGAKLGLVHPMTDDATGTYAIHSEVFHHIRGYDESLRGWGFEDSDLYARAYNYGESCQQYPRELVKMLGHDNDVRSRYHEVNDLAQSWEQNKKMCENPHRGIINPQGYGVAKCTVWHT